MRQTFYTLALFAFLLVFIQSCDKKEDNSPNIVLIFMDDMGYADLSSYGAQGYSTPNIDALAQEGIRFTDFQVSEAVSSASRSSLLTGCYASRLSLSGAALHPNSNKGLSHNELTIAELLKQKDYHTAIYGKWHLGDHPTHLPLNHGFDEYFGLPYSNDMWPYSYQGERLEPKGKGLTPELCLIADSIKTDTISSLEDQSHLTEKYTDKALDFIQRNQDERFFLYLPYSMPHTPIAASEQFDGTTEKGIYGDVITEVDYHVGRITKLLKDLDLEENTLVIFLSDNGPWLNFGDYSGSAGPLREGKGTMWEGGSRIPCIMRYPGVIPAGTTCDLLSASIDILPTLAEITGTKMAEQTIDGVSILPYLKGNFEHIIRNNYASYYGRDLCAVRNAQYKLFFPHTYRSYEGLTFSNDGSPSKYNYKQVGNELYDLWNDISERNDVYSEYPEEVAQLTHMADSFRTMLGDRLRGEYGSEVRDPARLGYIPDPIDHLARNAHINLYTKANLKYRSQGAQTLINGLLGSHDFSDNRWLGFTDSLVTGEIVFDSLLQVKQIDFRFFINQGNWIFGPSEITCTCTTDDGSFTLSSKDESCTEPGKKDGAITYPLEVKQAIRSFKFEIKSIGNIPEWHIGVGNPAWLFMDEIIVTN